MNKKKLLLIGAGGHAKSVIDTAEQTGLYTIHGIIDLPYRIGEQVYGYSIIGSDTDLQAIYESGITHAFVGIGSILSTQTRAKITMLLQSIGFYIPTIVDPSAIVSSRATLCDGVFVGKGVIINTDAFVGPMAILNSGCLIEHDCSIGQFSHIAPGVTLSGSVSIGEHTHIGTNSTIIQNVCVGNYCIVGAGSVVIKAIENNSKYIGNPARKIK